MMNKRTTGLLFSLLIIGVVFAISITQNATPKLVPQEVLGISATPTPTSFVIAEAEGISLPSDIPSETPIPTQTEEQSTYFQPTPSTVPISSTPLITVSPTVTETKAGSVTKITYKDLKRDTIYKFDLSSYATQSLMAIKWPKSVLTYWSTASDISSTTTFNRLPVDDEGDEGQEFYAFSGLLDIPTNKIFYFKALQPIPTLTLALLEPSNGVDAPFTTQVTTGVYNFDSGASYTSLPIRTRDEWGANPAAWDSNSSAGIDDESRFVWYPVYYKAARIIIHHTVTTPNTTDPAAAVRSVYLYHAYVREWGDVGYNFLIDQNGSIYQGKLGGDETLGYHAFGAANQTSIGISLIGDFTYTRPSSAQQIALTKLMAEKAAFYDFTLKYSNGSLNFWKDSSYTVFGHRDSYNWNNTTPNTWGINNTACPGNSFYPILATVTVNAEYYRQTNFASLKAVVADVNASFAAPHDQGVIVVKYNYPDSVAASTIEALLPKYSGITSYTIDKNIVTIPITSSIIVHPRYGDSEYLVTPMGFTGYYNEFSTYTPAFTMNGPEDRAKTLLKIFKLDSHVAAADVIHTLEIQE